MKPISVALVGWLLLTTPSAAKAQEPQPQPRVVELKTSDGTLLKATYFSAGKPGPGVLLFHQNDRTRTSWDGLARQLATIGINTVAVDGRGHGVGPLRRKTLRTIATGCLTTSSRIPWPGAQLDRLARPDSACLHLRPWLRYLPQREDIHFGVNLRGRNGTVAEHTSDLLQGHSLP